MTHTNNSFLALVKTVETLLSDTGGCPWDKKQTHATLMGYLKEESLELEQAFLNNDWDNVKEELGDVLFIIVFHCVMAAKNNKFNVSDVINAANEKLIRRHPHVFGDEKNLTPDQIVKQWHEIKKQEKLDKQNNKKGGSQF